MEISIELLLPTFNCVFEEKSFSNAGYRPHRSQSRVSPQIKLEEQLGCKLFDGSAATPGFPVAYISPQVIAHGLLILEGFRSAADS